jgi:hypothetical protein
LSLALLLALAACLLNVGDWLTTRIALLTGKGHEVNAFMASLIAKYGVNIAVGGKALIVSAICFALALWGFPLCPQPVLAALVSVVAVYVVVIVNNLRVLLR